MIPSLSIVTQGASSPGPVAAGASSLDVLVGLFVLLIAAKSGEEILRRLGLPGVVGELLGGFVVGPHLLGLVTPTEAALAFSEIGAVILLFGVGLEVRVDDLLAVGRPAALTAVIGLVLPILAGAAIALAAGTSAGTAAFVGLALCATSIGITSRVLSGLGLLDRRFARVVLGAAVIDDILALVLIGVVSGAATGDLSTSALLVVFSALGLIGVGFFAARRARGLPRTVFTWPVFADSPILPAFIFMLAIAEIAAFLGLAAIIGAFVAGLIIAETEAREEIEHETRPLAAIFTPFFFAVTGAALDLGALLDLRALALTLVLVAAGVLTKWLGGAIGARSLGRWGATTVGVGMVPRGEVGIVVANIGLGVGLLTDVDYSAVLAAVVLTTVLAPFLLSWTIPRALAEEDRRGSGPDGSGREKAGAPGPAADAPSS